MRIEQEEKEMREYYVYKMPDNKFYAIWKDMLDRFSRGAEGGELIKKGKCKNYMELCKIKKGYKDGNTTIDKSAS